MKNEEKLLDLINKQTIIKTKYNIVDLFCGAGGLSLGFHYSGFKNIYALEFSSVYAKTYKTNFPKTKLCIDDICNITNENISNEFNNKQVDVIIGGPPCQGFSKAGNIGRRFLDDKRNSLFKEYLRFVEILKPKIFIIENVAALEKHNNGKTIKEIKEAITKIGYIIQYEVLNSVNFNVPQERRRIFIIGTRNDFTKKFTFPSISNEIYTIKDAIDDLPTLNSGEKSDDSLHCAMNHSEQMLKKMSFVRDGGDRTDIPDELRPKSGDIRKYIRYNSNKPSYCITGDMRKVFHYSQNRALTCRELARIQTFPDTYKFCGSSIQIQQQIGNAVPVLLAYEIAKCVKRWLDENE